MKSVLYVPYSNGDCVNGFSYDKNITEKEYSKMMIDEYNTYSSNINEIVKTRYSKNMSINPFIKQDNHYKQQTYSYNDCNCIIYNINNEDSKISELLHYSKTKEEFVLILKLNKPSVSNYNELNNYADLETEIKMWMKESSHITNSNRLSDEEKIFNLPKKDFKVNLIDDKVNAVFKDCKLIEIYNNKHFAMIVKNVYFINNN